LQWLGERAVAPGAAIARNERKLALEIVPRLADDRPSSMGKRAGFTLIEICLAIMIGFLMLGLAIPSVAGIFAEQRLKKSFERFDDFVREAQMLSVSERRAFVMGWEAGGIALAPEQPLAEDRAREWPRLDFESEETLVLSERPAALEKEPPMEWVFWRSGTCEPVVISYKGPAGIWKVQYDALTVRSTFLEQQFQ
jgi:hypothetical protein